VRLYFCLVEPITEYGMTDYRLDEVEKPERHSGAVSASPNHRGNRPSSKAASCPDASSTVRR